MTLTCRKFPLGYLLCAAPHPSSATSPLLVVRLQFSAPGRQAEFLAARLYKKAPAGECWG